MLMSWWQQTPRVIALELKNTMKRLEIDDALFKLAFLVDINETTLKAMSEIVVNNEKFKNGGIELVSTNQTLNLQKHLKYYDGKVILEFIIREYNKTQELSVVALGSIFALTFFFVFSTAIYRSMVGQTLFGNSALEYICFGGNGFMIFFLVFITTLFFVAGIRDMKRRLFILQQLGQMISPKKMQYYKNKKLLPTVNFLDQVTLHSWIDLRKLAIDYGKKYFYRHEIFMPVAFYLAITCLMVAFFMIVDKVPFSNDDDTTQERKKMVAASVLMSIYFFVQFFWLLYSASYINEEFTRHREILKLNKDLLQDILMFKEFYFAEKLNPHLIQTTDEGAEDDQVSREGQVVEQRADEWNIILGEVQGDEQNKLEGDHKKNEEPSLKNVVSGKSNKVHDASQAIKKYSSAIIDNKSEDDVRVWQDSMNNPKKKDMKLRGGEKVVLSERHSVFAHSLNFDQTTHNGEDEAYLRPVRKYQRQDKIFLYDVKSLLAQKGTSFLHRKISKEISEILGSEMKGHVIEYMKNLLYITNICIEQLKSEEEFNSFKIIGIVASKTQVNNLLVGLISIVATVYEIFLNK